MGLLVVLTLLVCPAGPAPGDYECDDMEVRARTCEEAAAWALGWVPPGFVVVAATCRDERRAEAR